ncbi:hypothetical protein [Sphingomonas sp. 1185]|uniref:hypothetical protein n=1 Tax=Sphingomonas sp. 1185 TaxID=3156411 RepID=UPI00339601ED
MKRRNPPRRPRSPDRDEIAAAWVRRGINDLDDTYPSELVRPLDWVKPSRDRPPPECPRNMVRYWLLGWDRRAAVRQRWDDQAAQMEAQLDKARRFLDRDSVPGKLKRSSMIALRFYVLATGDMGPDYAWTWFQNRMADARDEYREAQAEGLL